QKRVQSQMKAYMEKNAKNMQKTQNKKRLEGPTLEEGGMVYLLRRNIRTKRPSTKLDHTKLGPFKIKKVLGPVTFELELPKTMRIHPVFHRSLLETCENPDAMPGPIHIDEETAEPRWEVEKVIQYDQKAGYLVKWLGWDSIHNTWEPKERLTQDAPKAVQDFHSRQQTNRSSQSRPMTRQRDQQRQLRNHRA